MARNLKNEDAARYRNIQELSLRLPHLPLFPAHTEPLRISCLISRRYYSHLIKLDTYEPFPLTSDKKSIHPQKSLLFCDEIITVS